ncbi:MAG: flavodoxin family protein [Candidatus Thorarchaeota archaeon]|jgi:multimeric flavodoxin WrbA
MKDEPRRIFGVVGSPRRNGNTEILVDEVLKAAEENGAVVHKVILSQLDISPCRACDTCKKKGKCVHQDDMVDLVAQIEKSDVLVLGTPIYWWGPTAQFKAFLDRWYGVYDQGIFKGKETVLVIPLEDKTESTYNPILNMFKAIMEYLHMNHVATVLAPGVLERGAVRNHQEFIDNAREIGIKLASVNE